MKGDLEFLRRYTTIVDDVEALIEAADRPLPRIVWANPIVADPARTAERILAHCPEAEPLGWRPWTWRLPPDAKPGYWIDHVVGAVHVQEEAALLAGDMVQAQPGERVLDMCAAPGGKTAQMAVAMNDRGSLVAIDRARDRLAALRRTLERLGITCALVHQSDALRFRQSEGSQPFDRILVDGPCTCEGTTRKNVSRRAPTDPGYRDVIIQTQKALLRKAVQWVKPGGQVVYSTCTYSPEENEAVLDALPDGAVAIEPVVAPEGFRVSPGITRWGDASYRADAVNAMRIWPHHNDTGGFFVARLRRL
jgi:16S rRNA C967 or C1407 C5-methylase (RsmB/RsmF family)